MAVYYVDSVTGDDADTGLTEALAWASIAKVNTVAFNAGDSILFKRGQTFVGEIHPSRSGAAGTPILYSVFGAGARPIIDGSGDHAFYCSYDHHYVHHMWIEHIDFSGSLNHVGDYDSTVVCNTHDMNWYDCIFRDSSGTPDGHGFGAQSNTGAEIYNITIDTCYAYDNTSGGICIASDTGADGPYDCEIKNCVAHDNGTIDWYHHGIYIRHGVSIHDNNCYNNLTGAGIKVNAEGHHSPFTPVVYDNVCYGNMMGLAILHQETLAYNNIIYENTYNINLDDDSHDCVIVFNTLINATSADFRFEGSCADTIIEDNIIIEDRAVHDEWFFLGAGGSTLANLVANNTIDYNIYWSDGNTGINMFSGGEGTKTWVEWLALAGANDVNSTFLGALPDFVARYSNFHIIKDGNLDGLGLAIVGYATDYDGVARADPPTPGAYEPEADEPPEPPPGGGGGGGGGGSGTSGGGPTDVSVGDVVEIYLCDPTGVRVECLDYITAYEYAHLKNEPGPFRLRLPAKFNRKKIKLDGIVEIWRGCGPGTLKLDYCGFVRAWVFGDDAGNEYTELYGFSSMELLKRRVIAYFSDWPQADMTDQADDMIKAIVKDNLGTDTTAPRDISAVGGGFTIAVDMSDAYSMDKAMSFRNVLEVCQEIAEASSHMKTTLYFDVVPVISSAVTGMIGFQLKTFTDQRGNDRTWDSVNPLYVGPAWGNLENCTMTFDYSEEYNHAYVLGRGEGSARDVYSYGDTERTGMSIWNRREAAGTSDAQYGDDNTLASDGWTFLQEGYPKLNFIGDVVSTTMFRYGKHWGFGDRVTMVYAGYQTNAHINKVHIKRDENGQETITAHIEIDTTSLMY